MGRNWTIFCIAAIVIGIILFIALSWIDPQIPCERAPFVFNATSVSYHAATCTLSEWYFGNSYIGSTIRFTPEAQTTANYYTAGWLIISLGLAVVVAMYARK